MLDILNRNDVFVNESYKKENLITMDKLNLTSQLIYQLCQMIINSGVYKN